MSWPRRSRRRRQSGARAWDVRGGGGGTYESDGSCRTRTHRGPKLDRLELLRATHTNLESIFLIAPDTEGAMADRLRATSDGARPADATAELAGVQIRLWRVSGPLAEQLTGPLSAGPLYIADGHHRYETAVAYASENRAAQRLLGFVVSARDDGLVVLPTHRVIYATGRDVTTVEAGCTST
jgi:uncharacterized protein (DUF1015 family)